MYYRQPQYYRNFKCVGGTCKNSCCEGWRIDWTAEEVGKLKSAGSVSPKLRELIENSFELQEPDNQDFKIKLNENGSCPFLTDEKLCLIQKEIGSEYLSNTCMNYPRINIVTNSIVYRFCHITCPEVAKVLICSDKALNLINLTTEEKEVYIRGVNMCNPDLYEKMPGLKYYAEVFEFFYEIIADKRRKVEDSIVLGALVAQALSKAFNRKSPELPSDTINKLRTQMRDNQQIKHIENIKPNYNVKLGILGQLLKLVCRMRGGMDVTVALIDNEGKFNIDLYNMGEDALMGYLSDKPFVMRNIALNLLFELNVPFRNEDFSVFENYAVYATTFALLKLDVIAVSELQNRIDDNWREEFDLNEYIIKSIVTISRTLCQNHDHGIDKIIMDALNGNKMVSPAYLALLVK